MMLTTNPNAIRLMVVVFCANRLCRMGYATTSQSNASFFLPRYFLFFFATVDLKNVYIYILGDVNEILN